MAQQIQVEQINSKLKDVHKLLHKIESARNRSETDLQHIEKLQDDVNLEGKLSSVEHRKLKLVYSRALDDAAHEEGLLRDALETIHEIRSIRNERRLQARCAGNKEAIRRGTLMKMLVVTAQTLPLYVSKKPGAKIPPLCGSVPADPSYVAKMGDMVAAFVKGVENEENWILAEVISYNQSSQKYEVDDVDEEEKERYVVSKRRIVPLPLMRVNPLTDPGALYPKGAIVMALYPQTTCFYKAIINVQPATAQEDYEVFFEDAAFTDGYSPPLQVPQRYVISMKEGKRRAIRK